MADAAGDVLRLRDMKGRCDLCGDECHANTEICVAIACSRCVDLGIYHQGCIEKFLKKHGFDSIRKTGFPCPRGRGKGTSYSEECKGRADRSHPIVPKNEEKKKKALAPPMHEVMSKQVKGQELAKPLAKPPRKVPPVKAHQVAPTVLRSGIQSAKHTPSTHNAWHTAGINNAIREPAEPSSASEHDPNTDHHPKSAHVPVGLVLEEALTKAQKKNLARRKKKAQGDTTSETGTAVTDNSSLDDFATCNEQQKGGVVAGSSSAASQLLNGTNFVTDIKRYQQLLGMYMGESEDEEDDSESESQSSSELAVVPQSPEALSARPSSSSSACTTVVVPSTPPTPGHDEDAALRAAMEQSMREFALQQEMQRQREILAGYGSATHQAELTPAAVAVDPPVFNIPKASFELPSYAIPVAEPVVSTAAPVVCSAASLVSHAPPTVGYTNLVDYQQPLIWQKQEQAPIVSTQAPMLGYNFTYGAGVNVATSNAAATAAAYGVAPMAAGHGAMAATAGGDEDDDLSSLLALCGVAG